jgi:hypothetical protein
MLMGFCRANDPAQARRAKGVQSETAAQNRRCLQPAGSAIAWCHCTDFWQKMDGKK